MNVTILSKFRNSNGHVDRYFRQMQGLYMLLAQRGDRLNLILGYGDSTDGTGQMLFEAVTFSAIAAQLVDVSHGGQHYGSIEHPERFKQLAYVGNKMLACVPQDSDVVGIVESDLRWQPRTLMQLINHLAHVPAVAPMLLDAPPRHTFYDVWGYRKNGVRFTKEPPYCEWLDSDMLQLDSAGSVLLMRAEYARKARYTDDEEIVGLCKGIYGQGGSVWLDPSATVLHP